MAGKGWQHKFDDPRHALPASKRGFEENDPEGVAFEYDVIEIRRAPS